MDFCEHLEQAMNRLYKKGAFLTVKDGERVNTMTISWGSIGFLWGKPHFMTMVRTSRYTFELLKQATEFTVSIPVDDRYREALGFCGSKSGRDVDKIEACRLPLKDGISVSTPVIKDGCYVYECHITCRTPVGSELLSDELQSAWYRDQDYHTFFYGEIKEAY